MAWEKRTANKKRPQRRYAYKSIRVNGKVKKIYLGAQNDPVTRLVAAAESLQRAAEEAARAEEQAERDAYGLLETMMVEHERRLQPLVEAQLVLLGCRQHGKEWTR